MALWSMIGGETNGKSDDLNERYEKENAPSQLVRGTQRNNELEGPIS